MTLDMRKAEDELALNRFLVASGHADLPELVAEVSARVSQPERAAADMGQPSPLASGITNDLIAAGGLNAVDVTAFVRNAVECRLAFREFRADDVLAGIPEEEWPALFLRTLVSLVESGTFGPDTFVSRQAYEDFCTRNGLGPVEGGAR